MSILTKAINALSFGAYEKALQRAYYEGAKVTRLNRDFNVTNQHFELQAGSDRELLKARARWLSANNPITHSIDKSLSKNVIGTGIRLQSKIKDTSNANALNKEIERLWSEWIEKENFDISGRFGLYDFQDLCYKTKLTDGEILINLVYTKDKKFPFKIQLIESDYFDTYHIKNGDNYIYSGVEVNGYGKPIAYYIKKDLDTFTSIRVARENIIHYFDVGRVSQYRGMTDYAQTINNLKDFSAYNDSEIIGARARSMFALFVKTANLKDSVWGDTKKAQQQGHQDPIKELTAGMIKYLRPNEEIQTLQANQTGNNYSSFVTTIVRLISAGRDVSYELAFRDYSQVNFSSARASILQDHKRFDIDQLRLVTNVLTPIYKKFVESMVLSGRINLPNYYQNPSIYHKPIWTTPKRDWVDPLKDIKTLKEEIELGITTRSEIAQARGKDYEDVMITQIEELKQIKKLREEAGLIDE